MREGGRENSSEVGARESEEETSDQNDRVGRNGKFHHLCNVMLSECK